MLFRVFSEDLFLNVIFLGFLMEGVWVLRVEMVIFILIILVIFFFLFWLIIEGIGLFLFFLFK